MLKRGLIWMTILLASAALGAAQPAREPITAATADQVRQIAEIPRLTDDNIFGVAWSPDSEALALATASGIQIYQFMPTRLQLSRTIDYDTYAIRVAWSPDGALLASGYSLGGRIWFWDAATGAQLYSAAGVGGESQLDGVAFSPDGALLATYTLSARSIRLWGVTNADGARETLSPANISRVALLATLEHDDQVSGMAFRPDSRQLATGAQDGLLRLWDMDSFSIADSFRVDYASSVAWLPDASRMILNVYPSGDLLLLNPTTSLTDRLPRGSGSDQPWRIAVSPDGSVIARGYYTLGVSQIDLWDVENSERLPSLAGHAHGVTDVVFSPDGTLLATNGWSDSVRVWGLGEPLPVLTAPPPLTIGGLALVNPISDTLNMRSGPGLNFNVVAELPDDMRVELIGEPQDADGYRWWQARTPDGIEGWIVEKIGDTQTLTAAE